MKKRVAIIHDWLLHYRGGERVLEAICELYPHADIYTIFYRPGRVSPSIERHKITPSFLNSLPRVQNYYRYLLPLFPMAVERWDLSKYDVVISSSHCAAKGVIVPPHAMHVSYVYTPVRYAWDHYWTYFGGRAWEWLAFPFLHYLRQWDVNSSVRVDRFLTLSQSVAARIRRYYRRDADVVAPFVDLKAFTPSAAPADGDYYLVASALVPYKRIELAIEACRLAKKRLVIVGEGPELSRLMTLSDSTVTFTGKVSLERLKEAYQDCKALLFPGEEDFGIVPLEAMAMGRPVIAYGRGGVLDTVIDGETGLFFDEPTAFSLVEAMTKLETGTAITPQACRARAAEFSREKFKERFQAYFEDSHRDFSKPLASIKSSFLSVPKKPSPELSN